MGDRARSARSAMGRRTRYLKYLGTKCSPAAPAAPRLNVDLKAALLAEARARRAALTGRRVPQLARCSRNQLRR